ncbi:hypothetical protein [Enterococcus phage 47]|nr:hypothetical protein [Enterococcus phage 47]
MKLKDLLKVVDRMQDITLEIAGVTAPEGIYAQDIPVLREQALEMEVVDVHTAWYNAEDNIETTLGVVVKGGNDK